MTVISHNLLAMNANRMFGINNKSKAKSTEKLSSGYKINRSADDAAGLAISEKMRKQIRGLTQGVANTQDGISLCQVADGALSEVTDMLHRINQLSVQAANGTYSDSDRQYMQDEISQLLTEVDRIGDTTKFNELYIFKGSESIVRNPDGTPFMPSTIPVRDFTLADISLGATPFTGSNNGNYLALQAVVNNPDSLAYQTRYNLIFGNGSTSNSSARISYNNGVDDVEEVIQMGNLAVENFQCDEAARNWQRDLRYTNADGVDITFRQSVQAVDVNDDEKKYVINYDIINNSSIAVEMDFMFHADTAYNNNDRCEGYFDNGNRIEKYCVYSQPGSPYTAGVTSPYVIANIPNSFSIVDMDSALAFSEKIAIHAGTEPSSLSIGHYSRIDDWPYYDSLSSNLGAGTNRQDLGFSMIWDISLSASGSESVGFDYGIMSTEADQNLNGVPLNKDTTPMTIHSNFQNVWIQSGCEGGDGIWMAMWEMNSKVLGIDEIDVTTVRGVGKAIDAIDAALQNIARNRSTIGAQQNRLEHTVNNESNIVENTQAAESVIRDTDMAKEMVQYSNYNILMQAGQAILAQANQSSKGVLTLLS